MITKEEENFIRVALLLTGTSHKAVRAYFDLEFDPSCLNRTFRQCKVKLTDLKIKRVINTKQFDLLFPISGQPADSSTFDITLMITILKNLANIVVSDHLPGDADTSVGAALGRIKYYRNHLAHLNDSKIEQNQFEIIWSSIAKAVKTLGGDLMYEETLTLKTDILNKQLSEENAELRQQLYILKQQLNDPVWNIRDIIQSEIEVWKEDDKVFVETSPAKAILQRSEENFCVTIVGSSGMGKTTILRHVALKMADKGYDIIPVHEPGEIKQYYNSNTKTVFVVDNLCGNFSAQKSEVERWEHFLSHFCRYIKKDVVKLMISCRLQVFNDELFDNLTLFKSCVCDLTSKTFKLSDQDLKSIAEAYVNNADEVVQYAHLYDCFPFLCKMFKECPSLGLEFFRNPYSVYENELNQMFVKQNYAPYCALALCVMFNNCVKEDWLRENIDSGVRAIFENTFEECKLNRGTSRLVILDSFETLLNTYLIKADNVYKVVHDKLFDIISHFFGNKMLRCMIQFASIKLVGERFVFQERKEVKELSIKVPPSLHDLYIRRVIDEWSTGNVTDVFSNINFLNNQFLELFGHHVTSLETSKQAHLAQLVDDFNTSVLHLCCDFGDLKCTKWALENGASVNICNVNDMLPLHFAAIKGHADIVNILLDQNACINATTLDNRTSLFFACDEGRLEIVNILLQRNADLNICTTNEGASPLFAASQKGYSDIVDRILQEKKADINKETTKIGFTPLFQATALGHREVVKVLLYYNASVNKCTAKNEITPLFQACANGHTQVVKMLLNNKAEVNKCTTDIGTTPLFVACQNGHTEIVKILINNKANINQCLIDTGATPLFAACRMGHTRIVETLVKSNVDINKPTTDIGATPLFDACRSGFKNIVEILLNKGANINMCTTDNGSTPLYIACALGHIDIVNKLLDHGADVNICRTDNGVSPLVIAVLKGYKEIVISILMKGRRIDGQNA